VPRIRSAKSLAKRIDLQYFAKLSSFRRWRLVLSIALPLLAAVWVVAKVSFHQQRIYSSGPMSAAHAVLGDQCGLCHVRNASYSAGVSDATCLSCHDAPAHNQRQTFTPACSSCHIEHKGRRRLAEVAETGCTQCHGDLTVKDGTPQYNPHISRFDGGHPEFAEVHSGQSDAGTINLNHNAHLRSTLRGPGSVVVQMDCEDCHRPLNVNQPWPYSVAAIQPASQQPVMVGQADAQQRKRRSVEAGPGAYMTPIRYVNQCAACHSLQFDSNIPPAPHDKPEKVRAFILQTLSDYAAAHPEALRSSPIGLSLQGVQPGGVPASLNDALAPLRQTFEETQSSLPVTQSIAAAPLESAQAWVRQRAAEAERLLWQKNCKVCHIVTQGGGDQLPTFVKAIIPSRWFPNAEFDHEAHRMMKCAACHNTIPQSTVTSDINLPGIKTCQNCHQERGPSAGAAEGRCFECHSYHDWRTEQRVKGRVDISQVRGKGPVAPQVSTDQEGTQPPQGSQ
jgi:Cytochrome c7 and related cytochrome c